MNGTIKFRVWDKQNKNWQSELQDGVYGWDTEGITLNGLIEYIQSKRDRFVIQQFTGLTDKNGREIYEGDIVTFENNSSVHGKWGENTGIVKFGKYGLIIENVKKDSWPKFTIFDNDWTGKESEYEDETVIGNIFENPELIK